MHSVTDRQTDGQMDDRMMPIADHTVQLYDRLKTGGGLSAMSTVTFYQLQSGEPQSVTALLSGLLNYTVW